jgi:hypothetical protein
VDRFLRDSTGRRFGGGKEALHGERVTD